MNNPNSYFSLFFIILLLSCSSIDIFQENTELPIRKRYQSFVIMNKEVEISGFSSNFIDLQVQSLMKEHLEKNGLVYDNENPDLVIRYTSNEDKRQREVRNSTSPYPSYYGYRAWDPWRFNTSPNFIGTSNYELLQVIIDFIDPQAEKLLMTLTGVTEVGSEKTKAKKIYKTTDKLIDYFLNELNESK